MIIDTTFLVSFFIWVACGTFSGFLLGRDEKRGERIIYTIDITLRKEDETYNDFIERAHREGLGRYELVNRKTGKVNEKQKK